MALALPGILFAQKETNKEVEQIIITKKGTGNEKLNIVVDGEKVTVNGDPLNKDKDANITITRRKIKDMDSFNDRVPGPGENVNVIHRQIALAPGPNKAMLGVSTQKNDLGAEVMNVSGESAAEKAGLKEGDIITEVDHTKIVAPDDLSKAIKEKNPGDKVTVVYLRNKKQYTTVAELTKWNAPDALAFGLGGGQAPMGPYNFDIQEFRNHLDGFENQRDNLRFYNFNMPSAGPKLGIKIQDLESGPGVKVLEVLVGSDAEKAGLKDGDIIKEVNGNVVQGADDMSALVRRNRAGKGSMNLKVDRNGKTQSVEVKFTRKIKTAEL